MVTVKIIVHDNENSHWGIPTYPYEKLQKMVNEDQLYQAAIDFCQVNFMSRPDIGPSEEEKLQACDVNEKLDYA